VKTRRYLTAAILAGSALLAFAWRVVPGYNAVFTPHGVSFQEPDAWFHMRTVHNLLAHFPQRSGFDPYAVYPGGENISTGPFWDYLMGSVAWLAGLGHPSEALVDQVGAWLPALVGALFPVLVFFPVRRLFGLMAALLSAVLLATVPGTFLWISHLGMADHHAVEALGSFLVLVCLVDAAESRGTRRWAASVLAGAALAAYLATRAAGVFVPAILAVSAIVSPQLAPTAVLAVGTACLLLIPVDLASQWREYTWLSLLGALAILLLLAASKVVRDKRLRLPPHYFEMLQGVAILAGAWFLTYPGGYGVKLISLAGLARSYLPGQPGSSVASRVTELQPLWRAAPGGFASLFSQFGASGFWLRPP
jgi:dolichyl-diphosphooligosaccharide--protein glycosyltransferase